MAAAVATGAYGAASSRRPRPREVVLGVAGLAVGLSSFAQGLYERSDWAPAAIIVLLGLMTSVVAVERWPRPSVLLAPAALAALAIVQYLSQGWAESAGQAIVEGQRTVLYAALLAAFVLLLDDARSRLVLLVGLATGTLCVVVFDLVELLRESPDAFVLGRLDEPLGYSNGQAFVMLLLVWPGIALAERAPHLWFRASGIALATLASCTALTIQSRGTLLGLGLSAVVAVAVLPGRHRRIGAIAVVGGATVMVSGILVRVYDRAVPETGLPAAGTPRDAALAALVAAFGAGLAWLILEPVGRAVARPFSALNRPAVQRGAVLALLVTLVIGAIAGQGKLRDEWDRFKALTPTPTQGRLATSGGNRYDYWRVALAQWRDRPLVGIGAGNYDRTYFLERRTQEDIRQPHSLELQTLAETGLLGALPLAGFVLAVGAGLRRARRGWIARSSVERGVIVAASGSFGLWLGHTSVDWLHLLPGVTAAALAGAAVLITDPHRGPPRRYGGPSLRPVAFAFGALAVASLGISTLADTSLDRATTLLSTDPARAATSARRAISLDSDSTQAYIVLSAAEARRGDYAGAREALEEARRRKPHDPVLPALLGDLAMRRGMPAVARADYQLAARLNPRDQRLQALAASDAADTAP